MNRRSPKYNWGMAEEKIRLKVLGSGTSMGVPTLACPCPVCHSTDERDKRLRPSLLLSRSGQNVVIDTTPDFRTQALRVGLKRLDAILLTHCHADHILGFDDLRPYNYRQKGPIPVYGSDDTFRVLRRVFSYVFDPRPTLSSLPSVELHEVDGPFVILGVPFIPVPVLHGEMEVLGFRFGRAAYLTDFSRLPESSVPLLEDLDDLILDALRDLPHPMHQTVEQALALVDKLQPKRAWFTHIAHDLGHAATNERLRKMGYPHAQLAWDGMELEIGTESPAVERAVKALSVHVHSASSGITVFYTAADWAGKFGKAVASGKGEPGAPGKPEADSQQHGALTQAQAPARGSVVAVGTFDGIHLGHQEVLKYAIARARESGAVATALTFEPPPVKVLRPEAAPLRISTNQQRMDWFGAVGMEAAVVLPFTKELAALTAEEFVDQILVRQLQVLAVVVGENFKFGRGKGGDVRLLRELGIRYGFEVVVHTPVTMDGEVISSTLIRKLVVEGDVRHAARLLGRPFSLTGEVVSGTGTGRKLLFPTLNLKPEQELLPARGVYITRTVIEGEASSHRSVTNVGVRPTFNGAGLSIETHLLDYSGNFTPRRLEVRFWKKLRDEKKFSGVDDLRVQIGKDIAAANKYFARLRLVKGRSLRSGE
ncbi:MAG TPA: bifunctional riboflavin kinase/FAD synthetase [Methylomirabilota bacterium]|nr:bifunctional riboflavin kinase/FAD synthetase [Methylomirabilota bacterium]